MSRFLRLAAMIVPMLTAVSSSRGASYYPLRLDDPKAVYLTTNNFPVHADGLGDDADALQQAINKVQETTHQGIVFVPEGQYRFGKTVHVWAGIRLIGYGSHRPVFVLGEHTPDYQDGTGKYMIHFVSDRPREGRAVRDANPGTFYSGISNIDMEIRDGNPAAVGIRAHYAQHCYLAHMEFRIGSGRAGIEEIGNEAEDLHFFGGDFGITMHKPSPSWPFLLIDSSFEGQRQAAIETEEGGLTIIRNHFKNVPTVIAVRKERAEELWMKDSRFEDITGPALIISDENSARTEINLENVVCQRVPVVAQFRESGQKIPGAGPVYQINAFTHGLHIADIGGTPEIKTTYGAISLAALPTQVTSDIPSLPDMDTWQNVAAMGAIGDGITDDTAVLREAIARHRAIYLPSGRYRVTDTITLKPDTVLIGLSPITTQIILQDSTPGYQGIGAPKPLLEAPRGGSNIVTGIGLDTGGINPRAVGAKWMAGSNSMMNDVRFLGGHGMFNPDGTRMQVYNTNRTADPDPRRHWDSEYYSLWVTDGGGGTFKDIWTPNTFAQAGLYVSDTATEGRVYAMSSEHHVRNEVKFRNVSNWQIYALQVEAERGEGPNDLPVEIDNCQNLTFANLYLYRVISTYSPFPYAVKMKLSRDIRFRNLHVYSPSKLAFDDTVFDETHDAWIRSREIASLNISGNPPAVPSAHTSAVLAPGAEMQKLVGGFNNIDNAVADPAGNIYFVDARWHWIYRWSTEKHELTLVRDNPLDPMGLAFDKSGNLLVVARTGVVYAIRPDGREDEITVLQPEPAVARPGLLPILPITRWRDAHDFLSVNTNAAPFQYVSPDHTVFIPAPEEFRHLGLMGSPSSTNEPTVSPDLTASNSASGGFRNAPAMRFLFSTIDLIRACGLSAARADRRFYVADEFGQKTWSFSVNPNGSLGDPKVFAEEGEAGNAVDAQGNVYVCAGNIFVYDSTGKQIDLIEVPERPTSLAFGGSDRQTLFIAARSSLYAVRTKFPGQ
jgi:sugar lactone lactonase YvrE